MSGLFKLCAEQATVNTMFILEKRKRKQIAGFEKVQNFYYSVIV